MNFSLPPTHFYDTLALIRVFGEIHFCDTLSTLQGGL